ncbi:MAG: aminotransferase class I/II-fold pyridoxal phosphate-dependent enzyme [Patescibacteria group bacterium]
MPNQLSPFIPPTKVFFPPEDIVAIQEGVAKILESGRLTLGEHTKAFEDDFARLTGTDHAIAVSSGTSAIEMALRALRIGAGDSVIVPTNTFFATAAAVVHAGATPIFVDCDETLSLDIAAVRAAVRPDTKAVIAVHIGGFVSPRMHELVSFCRERDLYLIEDAAHAQGSMFAGRPAGAFGHAATFSFYPTKVMTSGEGGMIVTNDATLAERCRIFRDQGKKDFSSNIHVELGANWRLSEIHAFIGRVQFKRLHEFIAARRQVAAQYDAQLANMQGLAPLREAPGVFSNYYKYIVFLDEGIDRALLKKTMKEQYGVGLAGEVYEVPLHKQPVFAPYTIGVHLPEAERRTAHHICLPMSAVQTREETDRVISSLDEALRTMRRAPVAAVTPTVSPTRQVNTPPLKVAVVGGSGFIGSHIVDALVEARHKVTVFDLMPPRRSDVRFITLDILNQSSVNVMLTGGFDAVYMLAAIANVNDVFNNPVETCDVNIRAVVNVLEAARKNKIPRVLLSSTVWLYEMVGAQHADAVTEDTALEPARVNHVYTATKLAAEQYCVAYQKLYGQNYTILRYGIPYGPQGRLGTVIYNFVNNALAGKPIVIQGDGSQARNFVYVKDLAEGNVAALNPAAANQTYNLDGIRPVSIKEVAEIVQSFILGTEIQYVEARPGDFKGFAASSEKAWRELGWRAHTDIREGIRQYIEWARNEVILQ